jgi:hypothetical protein
VAAGIVTALALLRARGKVEPDEVLVAEPTRLRGAEQFQEQAA